MNHARRGLPVPGILRALAFLLALVGLFGLAPASALADSGTIGPPGMGLHWETVPATPCVGDSVSLRFRLCECEYDLLGAGFDARGRLTVSVERDSGVVCVTCWPDTADVSLGVMTAAGTHLYAVRIAITPTSPDSSSTLLEYVTFPVDSTCNEPGGIPYLDQVVIGRPAPCAGCPSTACPGDSIEVRFAGTFPDDCIALTGLELFPSMIAGPLPQPPTVRLTYGINTCLGRPCTAGPHPWSARVRIPELPPLPGLTYQLPVEAYLRDWCQTDSVGTFLARQTFPFTVAESCSTSPPPPPTDSCYAVRWDEIVPVVVDEPGDEPIRSRCTATWRPDGSTQLVFSIGSRATISGVQGTLRFDDPGALSLGELRILWPGWQLARSAAPDGGERFIAFAGPGAPPFPAYPTGSPVPFLGVEVKHDGQIRVVTPDLVHLIAADLIVSDDAGHGLRACPVPEIYPGPNVATLCRQALCDANGDGNADVRDLVVMVNCLAPPENARLACPVDSLDNTLDCDGDGGFDLDDVFCCVRVMLGGDGRPDSTGLRDAPEIAVRFGLPATAADGTIAVPLRLGGWSAVAAARLAVAYPDERYELVEVTFADTPASWWTHTETRPGHVNLAVLDLGALAAVGPYQPLPLGAGETRAILRLRLRDGAAPGGELAIASSDFAAGDGVGLRTPNASPRLALAGGAGIALSAARPNPFAAATNLALTLPVAGPVDVAVFAATGRRVATLLRESAASAGVYELAWDGRLEAGARAPAGVYFVRVVTGPGDAARKVLFLPGGAP